MTLMPLAAGASLTDRGNGFGADELSGRSDWENAPHVSVSDNKRLASILLIDRLRSLQTSVALGRTAR
jgi:hypothetical protein